jgi:hypothetical protein
MSNPRRVRVHAARMVAEAWRAKIERAARARGDVSSEARLVLSVTDLLPPPARLAFEQVMRASLEWVWTDGEYRRSVPGGHTAYRPDIGELEIVIRLSDAIEAVGRACEATEAYEATEGARRSTERQPTLQAAEMRRDLDVHPSQQLEAVQGDTLEGIFQLIATGYSTVLMAYARSRSARNLQVSEHDGVIEIQFELEW